MARKSRKNLKSEQENSALLPENKSSEEGNILATAAYARLSEENGGHETDDSLQTQIMLIHDYIERQPDLKLVDTYVDNGFTGTNFDRPEFERMMKDVCSGKIQCVVVKDLSRFGRDYLETGHYLETIFPKMNVRFIAVTDEFDSSIPEDVDSLAVPIKNMINNMYAKDISRKITASFEARWHKEGGKLFQSPPYGYRLSEDKTAFIPEEGPADNIRVIYRWFLSGVSMNAIANRLLLIGEPSPSVWAEQHGRKVSNHSANWTSATVRRILMSPMYTGDMVYHRTEISLDKGYKTRAVDKNDWIIHENYNQPIILRNDFEAAQKILESNTEERHEQLENNKRSRDSLPNYFKGLVYCGCCRKRMVFIRRSHTEGEEKHSIYSCISKVKTCPNRNHPVQTKWLQIVVMDQIRIFLKTACDRKKLVKEMKDSNSNSSMFAVLRKKAESITLKIEQTEKRKDALYMDFTEGVLDKDDFQYMNEHYIAEKQNLEQELTDIKQKLHMLEKKADAFTDQVDHLEQYLDCREFDENLVHEMIDKIFVGKDNMLEIRFKCNDIYQDLLEYLEALSNE